MQSPSTSSRARRRLGAAVAAFILAFGCFTAGHAYAGQQLHMENALGALETALGQLDQAEPNKGGHRRRAMTLVREAISQVQEGIQWSGSDD